MIHDDQLYLQEKKQASSGDMAYTDKVEEALEESRLTAKERRLVEMVQDALGIAPQAVAEEVPMAEEEMVQEKPLPKYESIEELMKEIEHGTNEAAHKYKMDEMKRVYEALEAKVGSLEEGEHAEHIDQKAVKQMRKDIAALRKAEEKLRKEFDKKFSGKEKKETPVKEKATEALQEGFDLRKFLAENRK
jgi:ribosomal protein L16 Arg81 hydroxylase